MALTWDEPRLVPLFAQSESLGYAWHLAVNAPLTQHPDWQILGSVASDELTIDFSAGDLRLEAYVTLERSEPPMAADIPADLPPDFEPVDYVEIRPTHVRSAAEFTKFLKTQAQISDSASLYCERKVWGRLLDLLGLTPRKIPKRVKWPKVDK